MNNPRLIFVLLLSVLSVFFPGKTIASFSNETLHYVISYKWGMVHKDAGEATLTLHNNGSSYSIMLAARTKPWADKIFMVRDTLRSTVTVNGLKPSSYSKHTHEGGKYALDVIKFSYSGNKVTAKCDRIKEKNGKRSSSSKTLSATGASYDMLSIFYYLRSRDFAKMPKGTVYKANVFSGKQLETISIRNLGIETIKLRNGSKREAYHILFNFTSDGKRKSSADMDTWISTDSRHIPLLLEGSLPVGKVKCYYTGG